MLACELDVPVGIDLTWTVISATLATVFTFPALAAGTIREFINDKNRNNRRYSLFAGDESGYAMIGPQRQELGRKGNGYVDNDVSAATNGANIHWGSHNNTTHLGSEDTLSDTHSNVGLLDAERTHSDLEQTIFGEEDTELMSKKAFQPQPSNVFMATVITVYAGLTIGNIFKGLLWSLSLTSMHYCGLMSLKIPNGFVVFNPVLVVVAATICWNVCIVGSICMENMTDMLAQQLLFSVVATSGCAALHWTGMWSATFMTSSPPSNERGYPIALPFLVASIAIVTCLAANFLLVRTATVSRNKLVEIVMTRRELWQTRLQKDNAEAAARARSDFIASASHEIRTPLHHLQGFGDLLAQLDLSDEAMALLQSMQGATKTLSSITNNVLDWSRIENGKSEYNATTFDLRCACQSVVSLLPHKDEGADIEIFVVVAPDLPQSVTLDEGYLHRIIMNLLSNSIKFTKCGYVLLLLDLVEGDLVITVRDTGHGMPAEFLPVMFEPFKQARSRAMSRGTGLGLGIIKQLVHQMHGTISVESQYELDVGKDNSGTTFTAKIPLPQLTLSTDHAAINSEGQISSQIAILDQCRNPRVAEGMQLACDGFHYQSTVVDPLDNFRPDQALYGRWKYIIADISVLQQNPPISLALQNNDKSLVLLPFDKPSDLQKFPRLPAHFIPIRKPLVWHTFETQIAAAKNPHKDSRNVRFADDANAVAPEVALSLTARKKEYTILLVEDNPINQKLGQKMLTSLGYKVLLAENGEVAIDQLRRYDELIDLVLMDQFMPLKDGVTATRDIRAMEAAGLFSRSPRTIIAVTAGVGSHAQTVCLEAGMDDLLTEPLSLVKLEGVLSSLLPRH